MFEKEIDFPCAISDPSDEGHGEAIRWVAHQIEGTQSLTLWVSQKSVLESNEHVRAISGSKRVNVVTGRGFGYFVANGPVLALYAHSDDIGKITQARGITALCVVQWSEELVTWSKEVGATVLHRLEIDEEDREMWGISEVSEIPQQVIESLQSVTRAINHNNTISSGFEKSVVVSALLSLYDSGIHLPPQEIKEWVAAHGWTGDNPKRLAEYARRINAGSRPRVK